MGKERRSRRRRASCEGGNEPLDSVWRMRASSRWSPLRCAKTWRGGGIGEEPVRRVQPSTSDFGTPFHARKGSIQTVHLINNCTIGNWPDCIFFSFVFVILLRYANWYGLDWLIKIKLSDQLATWRGRFDVFIFDKKLKKFNILNRIFFKGMGLRRWLYWIYLPPFSLKNILYRKHIYISTL